METRPPGPPGKREKSDIKGNNKTFSQKRLQIVSCWTYLKKKEFFTQSPLSPPYFPWLPCFEGERAKRRIIRKGVKNRSKNKMS
jgi:hypothetical protein